MRRFQYRLRSILTICAFLAVFSAWMQDRARLGRRLFLIKTQLTERETECMQLRENIRKIDSRHAHACLERDQELNGPYQPLSESDISDPRVAKRLASLLAIGVQLYVNRKGDVSLADVPDTTDFNWAFGKLSFFQTLRFVRFTVGPILPDRNWRSPNFRKAYADALSRPINSHVTMPDERCYQEAKRELQQLPHVETIARYAGPMRRHRNAIEPACGRCRRGKAHTQTMGRSGNNERNTGVGRCKSGEPQ